MRNTFAGFFHRTTGRQAILLASTIALSVSAYAQQAKYITFDAPGSVYGTYVNGVNNLGEAVGFYIDVNYVFHGFVRSPQGVITSFDGPDASTDGYGTFGNAVNDEGVVVGDYTNADFNYGGLIRKANGIITTYRSPKACTGGDPDGCEGTGMAAINDFGEIAGGYVDTNFVQHSFVRTPNGTVIAYDAPGAGTTPGNPANISPVNDYLYQGTGLAGLSPGLNIWGAVSSGYLDGNYVYHGYLRSPFGTFTEFDAPGAGKGYTQGTIPIGLNDLGEATGFYLDSNNVFHGFAGTPGHHLTDFDAPGADTTDAYSGTQAAGLNDFGEITGEYVDSSEVFHGFLLSPTGKFTILDAPGADLTAGDYNGTFPEAINLLGVIGGYYVDAGFVAHGFLQVPCSPRESCQNQENASRQTLARSAFSARALGPLHSRFPSRQPLR